MKKYSWQEFDRDSQRLAKTIKKLVDGGEINAIYGIPRGGVMLAIRLSYILNLPLVERAEINSTTLVVDDIAGTGRTLQEFTGHYTTTLFFCKESSVRPNFWVREAKDYIRFPWAPEDSLIRGSK